MVSGTSIVTERSPYFVHLSFTLGQSSGDYRRLGRKERQQEGRHRQSDWAPGAEATAVFTALKRAAVNPGHR